MTVLKTPPRSPKANAFCERLVGTIRRECLDFMIPVNERQLRRVLREWIRHYNSGRPHSSLGPGIPEQSPMSARATEYNLCVSTQEIACSIPSHPLRAASRVCLGKNGSAERKQTNRRSPTLIKSPLNWLSFGKIPSSREINSSHTFLSPPICYDCSPCSPSSECGSDYWPVAFVRIAHCSWRTWHSGSNLQY